VCLQARCTPHASCKAFTAHNLASCFSFWLTADKSQAASFNIMRSYVHSASLCSAHNRHYVKCVHQACKHTQPHFTVSSVVRPYTTWKPHTLRREKPARRKRSRYGCTSKQYISSNREMYCFEVRCLF
jgi:hypothetical protein